MKRGGERHRQPDSQREYSEERRRERQTARESIVKRGGERHKTARQPEREVRKLQTADQHTRHT